jgi:predicted TIM-barrel fold metal-dependent hydrolase
MRTRRQFFHTAAGLLAFGSAAAQPPQGSKKFKVIDVHVHVFNSKIQGANGIPRYYPDATIEHQLELMDRGGVDKGFLISYNAEDVASEIRGRGQSPVELIEVANKKYQYSSWKAHRDRFWWFPDHINPLHENFLDELKKDFNNGAAGIKMLPIFHGLLPDHRSWMPVYDLCQKMKKPIIIDLSWWYWGRYPLFNESRERQKLAEGFRNWGDYGELLHPLFQRYKGVVWSLAHCGTAKTHDDYKYIFEALARHPNLSCDVAAVMDFSPRFIEELVKAVGPRKVMYGTDSPYWFKGVDSYRTGSRRWSIIAEECNFLSNEEKQLILADNAERFAKNRL